MGEVAFGILCVLSLAALIGLLCLQKNESCQQEDNARSHRSQRSPKQNYPPTVSSTTFVDRNEMNADSRNPRSNGQQERNPRKQMFSDRRLNTYFAGAVAFFALVQSVVSILQWNVMHRGLAQTNDTLLLMRIDQEAKLRIHPIHAKRREDGYFEILLAVHNIGKTEATILHRQFVTYLDSPPNYDEVFNKLESRRSDVDDLFVAEDAIMPDSEIEVELTISELPVGVPFRMFGYVVYCNVFGKEIALRKCFYYDPEERELRPVGRVQLGPELLERRRQSDVPQPPNTFDEQ